MQLIFFADVRPKKDLITGQDQNQGTKEAVSDLQAAHTTGRPGSWIYSIMKVWHVDEKENNWFEHRPPHLFQMLCLSSKVI